jgi:signal transduction histidine kinase
MTERVRALGGTLAIKSTPAGGTTITVVLPVQRKSTRRARQLEPVGVLI